MKDQLTLEMLCGYLPYGLKCLTGVSPVIDEFGTWEIVGIKKTERNFQVSGKRSDYENTIHLWPVKPIFRNLSTDLTREIEHNGERFVPIERLQDIYSKRLRFDINGFYYHINESLVRGRAHDSDFPFNQIEAYSYLFKWHFWIYDHSYFEKGIILDINDLKK